MAQGNAERGDAIPETPARLGMRAWFGVFKRAAKGFKTDNLTDWAAALTYYGVLSIFPALLVVVSLLGLMGRSATRSMIDNLGGLTPGPARQILDTALQTLQSSRGAAGVAAIAGIAIALWSASGYVAGFMRASNAVYDIGEGRPIWKTLPTRIGITAVLVILLAISAVAVVFTGTLADQAGRVLGIGQTAVLVWDIAKWPVLVIVVGLIFAILYGAAPNVRQPGFRWITPGSVLAVVLWIVASAAFGLYVANFGSYNKTYGAMASVIIFLVWLWISNIAVLLGVELNAELERGRAIQAGYPLDKEPYVQPRDTTKLDGGSRASDL
ncbi:MAG: YihY family inner membrane protein [Streptosporangiales bacterium]|nr:YihY family inner membrane protein [Streptosporangiales bacterium]